MTNSILFYTRAGHGEDIQFAHYDCCEHLGTNINDSGAKEAYIAIPTKELHKFFKDPVMIREYVRFITEAFGISFEMATEEEIAKIKFYGSKTTAKDSVIIKHTRKANIPNKVFNPAYNVLRYLWYRHYTNIAIIVTNLYLLDVLDPYDVLAIAQSYQTQNNRALLPTPTMNVEGILFFRPREEVMKDLASTSSFNSVFYRYPIYFNPVVEVSGSFFSEAKNTIAAKETIARLGELESISELPGFVRNNIKVIAEDYMMMKKVYASMTELIRKTGLQMSFANQLLLSRTMDEVPVVFTSAIGSNSTKYISLDKDGKITMLDTPTKPVAKKMAARVVAVDEVVDEDFEEEEDDE